MTPLLVALFAAAGFVVAYLTYGRWLGRKIFELSADRLVPSRELEDGTDYVPTHRNVVFGHHFASIAGTGPIVGPAIAILWGWVPALLWVLLGSIFIGAVHDFGALVVSLRNKGQTVGEIAGRLINPRVRLLFLCVLFLALMIVLAIFGLVIAAVFRMFPSAIFPCVVQIPFALGIGYWLHRRGISLLLPSIAALVLMYTSVYFGDWGFLHAFNSTLSSWSNLTWVAVLLLYSYAASVMPVWSLLQPRDYINALQLISAGLLVVVGLVAAAFFGGVALDGSAVRPTLEMVAPAINLNPAGAPPIFPFLFITIACGAISGFHCLVSSGTSSKQLSNEADARFVGYGGMLTEGFLAVLVILACGAGLGLGVIAQDGQVLTGQAAWLSSYASWGALAGLASKVGAFVKGSANFLAAAGLPRDFAIALMGVFVASFAGTTLDSACRLQRYVVQELARATRPAGAIRARAGLGWLENKHGATIFAVGTALLIAAVPPAGQAWSLANAGKGGQILWPLFGATNQLLGGLSFVVITFYLLATRKPVWFIAVPAFFMLFMPMWAMLSQMFVGNAEAPSWLSSGDWLLVAIGGAIIILESWMIVEAVRLFPGLLKPRPAGPVPAK